MSVESSGRADPFTRGRAHGRACQPSLRAALDTSRGLCYNRGMSKPKPDHLSPTGSPYWTDGNGVPHLNFAWAERHYGTMSDDALRWNIGDCRAAVKANPDNPKNGLYEDTVHVIAGILSRRSKEKA